MTSKIAEDLSYTLSQGQMAVLEAYPGANALCGELYDMMPREAFYATMRNCGDGLVQFLMTELSTFEGCHTLEEALRRIQTAKAEIIAVEERLLAMLEET